MPGKGAVIQGYGEKKAMTGIQTNGAGGVLTLGRSETSGATPSLGTDDEPVSLRAGLGVRLHGYGGIHTLERLPVDEEVPTLKGTARLEWEVESSIGYATLCSLNVSFDSPGNWVVGWVQTNNNTLGSWVNTATASGVERAPGQTTNLRTPHRQSSSMTRAAHSVLMLGSDRSGRGCATSCLMLRILSPVSSHSAVGSDPGTMPAPAKMCRVRG